MMSCSILTRRLYFRSGRAGNLSPQINTTAPIAPFFAAVKSRFARVHLHPERDSPEVGLLDPKAAGLALLWVLIGKTTSPGAIPLRGP